MPSGFLHGRCGPDPLCKQKHVLSSPEPIVKIKHLLAPQEPAAFPEAVPASTERPPEGEVGWSKGLFRKLLRPGELAGEARAPCARYPATTILQSASEAPGGTDSSGMPSLKGQADLKRGKEAHITQRARISGQIGGPDLPQPGAPATL